MTCRAIKTICCFFILLCPLAHAQNPFFFGGVSSSSSAVTLKQAPCSATGYNTTSISVTCTSNFTAGDSLLVVTGWGYQTISAGPSSVTACSGDSAAAADGNSPTNSYNASGGTYSGGVAAMFVGSTHGGCNSVTVNFSTGAFFATVVFEIAGGTNARDTSAAQCGATGSGSTCTATVSTTTPSTGAITTNHASDLIVSVISTASNFGSVTAPTGFTLAYNGTNNDGSTAVAYQIVSTIQTALNPQWTLGNALAFPGMTLAYN